MNRLFVKAGEPEPQFFSFLKKNGLYISTGSFGKIIYQEFKTKLGLIRIVRFQLLSEITMIIPCDPETLSFYFSFRGSFRFQTDFSVATLLAKSQGKLHYGSVPLEHKCTVEPTAGNEYVLFQILSVPENWPDQGYSGRMKNHFKTEVQKMGPKLFTSQAFPSNIDLQKSIWDCLHELQKESRNMDKLNVFQFLILLSAFGLLEKQKLQIGHEDTWDPEEHIASILAEHIILGMDESWSIQKMVKSSQLTRKKLNTIFKKYNGMTFRKFKISVRLGKAKELLITTSLRIHEISVRVGYPNPAHFSKLFKNKMGFPPSILRKRTSS